LEWHGCLGAPSPRGRIYETLAQAARTYYER
jgi:hypothetical protein